MQLINRHFKTLS